MVTENDVIMAYRLLVGREPESEQVVKEHAAHWRSVAEMRAHFIATPEVRATLELPPVQAQVPGSKPLNWPPAPVEFTKFAIVMIANNQAPLPEVEGRDRPRFHS